MKRRARAWGGPAQGLVLAAVAAVATVASAAKVVWVAAAVRAVALATTSRISA